MVVVDPAQGSSSLLLPRFLAVVAEARAKNDPKALCSTLALQPDQIFNDPLMHSLRLELQKYSSAQELMNEVEKILDDDWPGFMDVISAYLVYVVELDAGVLEGEIDATRSWIVGLGALLNTINPVFNSARGVFLVTVVRNLVGVLTEGAIYYDRLIEDPLMRACNNAANTLLRTFNNSLPDRVLTSAAGEVISLGRKEATIYIGCSLFRLYFILTQFHLTTTVVKNINAASIPSLLPNYPIADRCRFAYWVARYHFLKHHFTPAFDLFTTAYDLLPGYFQKHRRNILVHLIACGIILGRFPSATILSLPEAHGLAEFFLPLCEALKLGNFRAFRQAIGDEEGSLGGRAIRKEFWMKWNLYYTLRMRCKIMLWRSLFRRTVRCLEIPNFSSSKLITIPIETFVHIARWHHSPTRYPKQQNSLFLGSSPPSSPESDTGEEDVFTILPPTAHDIEGILTSLIDQGYAKGYIAKRAGGTAVFVLGRDEPFPSVAEIYNSPRWKYGNDNIYGAGESDEGRSDGGGGMGGGVVRLSGVRPIGM
ncbi:hypothetical protein RUND412_008293 [Rhizina undulata]